MDGSTPKPKPTFVIEPSEEAQSLLPTLVPSAQSLARPPISNYHVAAVGLGSSGRIFIGVNLEFPGLPLHHSVHAEQFLLTNLFLNAEPRLLSLAVSAAPCGHCRQFLQELRSAADIEILVTSDPTPEFSPLSNLLPHRFGPHNLLPRDAPLLLEPHHNALTIHNHNNDPNHKLALAALEAANKSHAPYSRSPSGVALVDSRANVFQGSYVESAAFNPSLGPVQAALVAFVAGGGGDYGEIVEAVLVEKESGAVKQEQSAKMLLHSISPNCHFTTFLASSHPSLP